MSRGCFGTAANGAVVLFVAFVFSQHAPIPLHADPLDAFLPDDADLNELLSDIPDGFDLSHAGADAIAALPWFTPEAAKLVLSVRDRSSTGGTISPPFDIEGLTPIQHLVIEHLAEIPVIRGTDSGTLRTGYRYGTGDGAPNEGAWYSRMRVSWNDHLAITIIGDRDAGEPHAVEAVSASLALSLDRAKTTLVVGDYRLGWGQGVLVSRYARPYLAGTGIIAAVPARFENTQFEESRFLRGVLAERRGERMQTRAWASRRTLDARVDRDGRIVGIDTDGLSSSGQSEVDETVYGAGISFTPFPGQRFGAAVMTAGYDPPLVYRKGEVFAMYREESAYRYLSLEGMLSRGPAVLVGEHVIQNGGEHGMVAGIEAAAGAVGVALLARHASEGFFSLRSGMSASFDNPGNEEGIYSAMKVRLTPRAALTVSRESARTLTRTTTNRMPESTTRTHAVLERKLGDAVSGTMTAGSSDGTSGKPRRWYSRLGATRSSLPGKRIGWQGGLAWSSGRGKGGPHVEGGVTLGTRRWTLRVLAGVFSLPSYDARYYRFDPDVPGRGMSRPVWGKGATAVVVARGGPCSVRVRWADSDVMMRDVEGTVQVDARW